MSSVGSAAYNLFRWLVKILSARLGSISGSHVINSSDFANKLNSLSVQSNVKLMSFYVRSLLTKVPIDDILDYLSEELQNHEYELPSNVTVKLISLCVIDYKFTFSNEYYPQTFGMTMGNPLFSLLLNLYVESFEKSYVYHQT